MKRFLVLISAVILAGCSTSDTPKPEPPPPPRPAGLAGFMGDAGTSPVGVIPTALLHNAGRNKDVDVSIEYPTRGGPFPVIVFSHGYGSSPRAYEGLVSHWTSYGYVCIRPVHADAGRLTPPVRDEAMERRREREDSRGRCAVGRRARAARLTYPAGGAG